MSDTKGSTSTITDYRALHKELDEVSCPICMDHPHNAVLLLCSSHDKGCRSFICDTSYRHSNCLDRFKSLRDNHRISPSTHGSSLPSNNTDSFRFGQASPQVQNSEVDSGLRVGNELAENYETPGDVTNNLNPVELVENQHGNFLGTNGTASTHDTSGLADLNSNLTCPMCRGTVLGFKIVKDARQYLDLKRRSCSQESCSFIGNYRELRRHARRAHPSIRPADIDPSRERAWQRLEHQTEYGDIMSAIRSAMPGAIVLGDYVIDNGDAGDNGSSETGEGSPWWTTFFLFQMISRSSPRRALPQPRGLSRAWARHRRTSGGFSSRRNLWGQNLSRPQDQEEDWTSSARRIEDASSRPRRRRRFMRSRSTENQR